MTTVLIFGAVVLVLLIAAALFFLSADRVARSRSDLAPRLRACPVCGKELKPGENILAERTGVVKEGREKIVIKGCPYCLQRM